MTTAWSPLAVRTRGEPAARPLERRRPRDRNKPEIPLSKPLLEEQHRLRIRDGRILAQNLSKSRSSLRLVAGYSLGMTLLRPRVDELLPVPAVAPRPPFVHVPA